MTTPVLPNQQQEAPRRAEDVLAELEDLLTVGLLEQAINGSVLSWGEAALVAHRIARHLRAALAAASDPDQRPLRRRVEGEPCRFADHVGPKLYCTFHGGWWVYGYCDAAPLAAQTSEPSHD